MANTYHQTAPRYAGPKYRSTTPQQARRTARRNRQQDRLMALYAATHATACMVQA